MSMDRTGTINPEMTMSLRDAVQEVLVLLTGMTLVYEESADRFRSIAQHLNRALRNNALEHEWSYYAEQLSLGATSEGDQSFVLTTDYRFRVVNDDAIRLVNSAGVPVQWGYFLPRDALHKYRNREGLWCSFTRTRLSLSRPLLASEADLELQLPVMREPRMFELPADPMTAVDDTILNQQIDFDVPDIITARAAWLYAQTDPVMQPRVQTLEEQYKDLMYQAIERDQAHTESPYLNEVIVPVTGSIYGDSAHRPWPVANERQASG